MPSDHDRLRQAFKHIERIKDDSYPAMLRQDGEYQIVERPWDEMPERSKLAILRDAVDWSGISNRDQAHILLSEIDPGKISDADRNRLIHAATRDVSSPTPAEVVAIFSDDRQQAPVKGAEMHEILHGEQYGPFLQEATGRALSRMQGAPERSSDDGRGM